MTEEDDRGMAFKVQVEELGPEVAELLESVNGEGVDREAVVVQIVQDVFVTENSRSEPDPASSCTEASSETDCPSLDELQQDTSESAKENNPAPTRYRPLVPKSQSLALKLAKMQLSKKVNSISARLAHADHPKRNPESKFYRPTFRSRRLPEPIPLPSRDSSTASCSADADKEQDPAATSREEASAPTSREEASAPTSKEAPAATSREQVSAPTSTNTGNSNLNRIGSDASGSTSRNPWTSISSVPGPSVATNSDGKASEAPAPADPPADSPADSVPGTSVSPSSDTDASDDPRSQSVITFFPRPGLPDFVTSPSASNRQRDLSPLKVPRTTHARPIGTERTACPLPFFPTLGVPETIPSQPTMSTDTSNVSATWPSVIPCQENVPVNPASVTSGPTHQASLSSSDNAVSRAVDHPDSQTIDSGQGYYEPPFYEITNNTYSIPAVGSDQSHVTTNPTLVTSGPMHQASLISSDYAAPRALDHPDRQSNEFGQDYYVTQFYDNRDSTQSMAAVDSDQRHVTTYPTLVTSGPMHQASMISSDYAVPRALDHPDRQSIESGQGYFVPPFYDNRDSTHSMAAVDSDQRHVTTNPTLVISSLRQQELLSSSDISDPRVQVHPDGQSGQAGYLPSFYDNIDHSTPVVSSDQIENIPRNTSLVIYEPRQAQRNVLLAQYNPGAEVNPNWQPGNTQEYIPVSPYHSGYTTTMPTGQYTPTNVPYAIPIRPMVSPFHHFPRPQLIWPTVDPSQQRSVALMPSVNPANIQHVSHVWPANASGQIVMVSTGSSSVISDPSHAPTSFSSAPPVQRQVTANTSAETPHEVYPMMPSSPTSSSSSEQSQASMASVSGADSTPTLRWNRMSLDLENRITRIRGPFPHYPYETLPEIIQRINSRGLDASSEEIAEMQTAKLIDHEMYKSMLSGNPTAIGYYQRSYQAMETPTSGIFDYPDRPPLSFCNNEAVIDISKALPEFFISDRNEQRARTRRQTSSVGRNQASRQAYGSSRQVRPRSLRHSRSNTQPTLPSSAEARVESEEAYPESMQDARERHVPTVGPEPEAAALERMQLLQSLSARNKETHTQRLTKIKYESSQTRRAASRQTVTESSVGAQNKRHEKTWTPRYQNKANTGSSARTGRSGKTTKTSSQTAEYSAQTAGSSAQTDGSSAETDGSSAQTDGSSAQTDGSAAQTSGSAALTSGSAALTSGSAAQTSGSAGQTSERAGQTSERAGQTIGSSAQTSGSSAQTSGSSAQTSGSSAQTSGSSAQTSGSSALTDESSAPSAESSTPKTGSSAQRTGSAAQRTGSAAQTTGSAAQTTGSAAQRTGSAAPTTESSTQTSRNTAQTSGSAAQTSGSASQTSGSAAQTSERAGQTSGSSAQTSGSSAQTSGSSAQTSGSSAQISGSAAQTSGNAAQTSGSAAQTSERADQTIGSSAQKAGSSAQTSGSSALTDESSAQTAGSSAKTTGNSAQRTGSAAQRTGSAAQTTGSAAQTTGSAAQTSRSAAQTSGSAAQTSGSAAQTSGSAAQTSERAAQTSERAGQTSERAGQTSERAGQTSERAGQTSERAGQTSERAGQTSERAGQTSERAGQTSERAGQTSERAGQTSERAGQTSERAGQTSERAGQTSERAGQTFGSSAQTSGSSAQSSGSSAQTSGSSAQTSGSSAQTSGSSAQTSGKAGKTSGKAGKTSGKAGKTSRKAGKTSGKAGKTSGSTARTENPNPAETEQSSPALNLRNSMDPSEAVIGLAEMGIIVTRSGHLYYSALASNPQRVTPALASNPQRVTPTLASNPQRVTPALASNPQRVTPALASNPQRVTSALSSSSSEFTASASWRARGQSQKLGSTSRQGHTRHRHRHDEVGRSSTDLETSDEERPESPTMDEAFSQAYTESRDAASEIIDEFNNIFDPIFCWFERRSPFPCNRSRERSQTAEPAGVEARSPESEQAFLKHYLMQVVCALQNPQMTCQLSNFQTTELMEIRLRLFARRAQIRAARASVRFDSLGLHRLAETFRTFADPLVAPITGLDSRVYVWQCQCGGQHEVPQPSPEQETEYCDIIVEFLNYESVITEAIIYLEREIMHRGLTQPITVTTNELGFSSRARGYVEVEMRRIYRNIGIEIGNRREAMMIRLMQPIARLHEYQRIFRSRGMAPPGLTNSELSQIPVVQQADASSQCESTSAYECSICLKSYKPRDEVRVLPCGHRFHRKCIDTWLKKTCSCPMCRKSTRDPNPE